jgi:hypothetical protein
VQLLFVFVKLDNREAQEAADNLLDEISFIREDEPDLSSGGICLTRPTRKAQKRAALDKRILLWRRFNKLPGTSLLLLLDKRLR